MDSLFYELKKGSPLNRNPFISTVLIGGILLLLGTTFQFYNATEESAKKLIELEEDNRRLKNHQNAVIDKIKSLSSIHLAEYIELKSLKERYLKADEMLGKMMLIFLADLQLNLPKKQKDWVTKKGPFEKENEKLLSLESEIVVKSMTCPVCPEATVEKIKKVVVDKRIQRSKKYDEKSWLDLTDLLPKPYSAIKNMMDFDIFRDLWSGGLYKKNTWPLYSTHSLDYLGTWVGHLRGSDYQLPITLKLKELNTRAEDIVSYKMVLNQGQNLHGEERLAFDLKMQLSHELKGFHPISHNHTLGGNCRGLILKSRQFQFHLMKLKHFMSSKTVLVGKAYSLKDQKFIGSLFLSTKSAPAKKAIYGRQ
jgi:hypothetical protein